MKLATPLSCPSSAIWTPLPRKLRGNCIPTRSRSPLRTLNLNAMSLVGSARPGCDYRLRSCRAISLRFSEWCCLTARKCNCPSALNSSASDSLSKDCKQMGPLHSKCQYMHMLQKLHSSALHPLEVPASFSITDFCYIKDPLHA